MILAALGHNLYTAPIQDPKRALDIGTGTGIWAIEFGDKWPKAEVFAVTSRDGHFAELCRSLAMTLALYNRNGTSPEQSHNAKLTGLGKGTSQCSIRSGRC